MPNWRDLVLPSESLYVNPSCHSVYSDWSECSSVDSLAEFEPFSDEVAECTGASCCTSSPNSDVMTNINWALFEPAKKRVENLLTAELWMLKWGSYYFFFLLLLLWVDMETLIIYVIFYVFILWSFVFKWLAVQLWVYVKN